MQITISADTAETITAEVLQQMYSSNKNPIAKQSIVDVLEFIMPRSAYMEWVKHNVKGFRM